jgi:hypothetical protein
MSKTIYFRETDPETGKAKWIKIEGVKGNNDMIFIDREKFEVNPFEDNKIFFVYKSTRNKRRTFEKRVQDGERFSYDLSDDEKLRLMTRK